MFSIFSYKLFMFRMAWLGTYGDNLVTIKALSLYNSFIFINNRYGRKILNLQTRVRFP